jgi:pimeloyl-ACP methyl ester carboxylesterase
MERLEVDNGYISYLVYGESNNHTIVLIHGFGLDSRVWKPQVEELSKHNKVVVYDVRGFGKSSIPKGEYDNVEDLFRILNHLKIEKAKIVGHSHGGGIAINFALEHKDMIESLILLSPSLPGYRVDNPFWEELQKLGRRNDKEGIKKKMLEHEMFNSFPKDSEEYKLLKNFILDYSCWHFLNKDMARKYDAYGRIKELNNIPTKVIYGQLEENSVKEIANVINKEVDAELIELEGVGHMSNLEKPEVINNLIEN